MNSIVVETVPHLKQRYDTAGDYLEDSYGTWRLTVSKMERWEYEAAVCIHELVEMFLTKAHGITWENIDNFDMGEGKDLDDPGADKRAPYHNEHMLATQIEKKFIKMLGLDWHEYDNSFSKLEYK